VKHCDVHTDIKLAHVCVLQAPVPPGAVTTLGQDNPTFSEFIALWCWNYCNHFGCKQHFTLQCMHEHTYIFQGAWRSWYSALDLHISGSGFKMQCRSFYIPPLFLASEWNDPVLTSCASQHSHHALWVSECAEILEFHLAWPNDCLAWPSPSP
jgi:hypothetical protein